MTRPLRILYPNAFYHVTCRGNNRRVIFRDDHDRTRFLERLRSALEIFSVRVHAYVLMRNYFHLIVVGRKRSPSEVWRLSRPLRMSSAAKRCIEQLNTLMERIRCMIKVRLTMAIYTAKLSP